MPQNGKQRARRASGLGNSSTRRAGRRGHVGGGRVCGHLWTRLQRPHVAPRAGQRGPCAAVKAGPSPARPPSRSEGPGTPSGPRGCLGGAGEPRTDRGQDRPQATGSEGFVPLLHLARTQTGVTGSRGHGVRTEQRPQRRLSHPCSPAPRQKSATRGTPTQRGARATCNGPKRGAPSARVPARPLAAGDKTSRLTGRETRGWGRGGGGAPAAGTRPADRKRGSRKGVRLTRPERLPRPRRGHRPRNRVNVAAAGSGRSQPLGLQCLARAFHHVSFPLQLNWRWESRQQLCDCHPNAGMTAAWLSWRSRLPTARKGTRPSRPRSIQSDAMK